jgi:oxepin-CoA hydrolase/3-oxo-5,6-dehydrosuberyl-CoA semialdehyde dehydrogenase
MITLSSYVCGQWRQGHGDAQPIHNPATEEVLGRCPSSAGIDSAAVLAHARERGSPALRALSFVQRADLLKRLATVIHEHRDELLDLSTKNGGNTRGDGKFDVDGATGTLQAYAALGRNLGERGFLVDGEGVQLGRTSRFWGQHVRVGRPGVAVHVNAFNFPAWGMGEKMACALLAGVPVIEKAGTPSALVALRTAQIVVESGILPDGAFQFVVGGVGDLLDHLGPMDCLAFTGSSRTGAQLKASQTLLSRNVRVNIEADSVNAAVLGPDLDRDAEVWNEMVSYLVTDMTQKAGQKCTAVRRILVPHDRVDAVVEALVERLRQVNVGDPADEKVRMGPVASARQLQDVREGITALAAVARVACGGAGRVQDKGYFVAPTLLVAERAEAPPVHDLEVFGPVATIVPYGGDAAEAVALANRGGGSLVGSVYSNDKDWTERVVLGMAPWHGRVWVGTDKSAGQSYAPGMVLPLTIHGGPGRAGGGEELGGLRGLDFYTQRTAVQGFQGLVAKSFGSGVPAATASPGG